MAKRIKSKAGICVAQTQDEVASSIKIIGDLTRDNLRLEAEMNDKISELTKHYAPLFEVNNERLDNLQSSVQVWCEANRDKLTENGKVKSANFVTGEVQWRVRPPSVALTKPDEVVNVLERLGLERFVRTKKEVNKDAILIEKDAVMGIAGIKIKSGVEDFAIIPFEQTAD